MNKEAILKLKKISTGFKVLCVEDDETIANQLKRILSNIFSHIDIEKDGLLGLEKFKQERHEIVITDITMPVMNGIRMAHKIKKINKNQTILVVSAHNETKFMTTLIEIGVDKFILKPIEMENFLEVLAKSIIKVYREKIEEKVDISYKKKTKMQEAILSQLATPLITIKNNKINFANKTFKKLFLKKTDNSLENFALRYIFRDKDFLVLKNDEIAKKLSKTSSIYQLYDTNICEYRNYKIDVLITNDVYLLSFLNLDSIKEDISRLSTMEFAGTKTFMDDIVLLKNSKKKYKIYCFGLKNIAEYIKEYGVKQINSINKTVARVVKKEFAQKNVIPIYLFDTNRYIALVDENNYESMQDSLNNFGTKYKHSKGKKLGFYLDFISNELDFTLSKKDILEDAQAMLYMLKS